MSLGFSSVPRKYTTLPGSVGNAILVRRRSQRERETSATAASMATLVAQRNARPRAAAVPVPTIPAAPVAPPVHDDVHSVYARASTALVDVETGEEVAASGARVLLVYPMTPKGDDVCMRLKRVDAVTGQLSYAWVAVYRPLSEERCVCDFTL